MYQLEISPAQAAWLVGHLAYEEGTGRDIYDLVRAQMMRGPITIPVARPSLQVLERYAMHEEPLSSDVQARLDVSA